MKTIHIITKSLKEHLRSYWIILLTLSMGPFFIFVYYLIVANSTPQYKIVIVNNDKGVLSNGHLINHGQYLISFFNSLKADTSTIPFTVSREYNKISALEYIRNKKADALIIISDSFSQAIHNRVLNNVSIMPKLEFIGDLTSTYYLISAVWANEIINEYALQATNNKRIIEVKETALGASAGISDFDLLVPGILIISIIMLMFTASIAFVSEIENKTIIRLKLSKVSTFEYLAGISVVQLMIGIASVLLTLLTAVLLGFHYSGSLVMMIVIAGLCSLSIIAFSLIIAAVTKSANEVLVVGNFPMFLFMFFTGAAFPLKSDPWFTIAGYPINLQGLMTPTHAISAMNKTFIMNMNLYSILPEIISIIVLSFLYFIIGGVIFKQRHLKRL